MPAIIKGGFWETNGVANLTTIETTRAGRRAASQALAKKGQMGYRELMRALNGAAPGAAALKVYTRVSSVGEELGGVRPIENEYLVNTTTSTLIRDDITADILNLSSKTTFGSNPPPNLDGNPLGTR